MKKQFEDKIQDTDTDYKDKGQQKLIDELQLNSSQQKEKQNQSNICEENQDGNQKQEKIQIKIKLKKDQSQRFKSNLGGFEPSLNKSQFGEKQSHIQINQTQQSNKFEKNTEDMYSQSKQFFQNFQQNLNPQLQQANYSSDEMEIPTNKEQQKQQEQEIISRKKKKGQNIQQIGIQEKNINLQVLRQTNSIQITKNQSINQLLDEQSQNKIIDELFAFLNEKHNNKLINQQKAQKEIQHLENVSEEFFGDNLAAISKEQVQFQQNQQILEEPQTSATQTNQQTSQTSENCEDIECLNIEQQLYYQLLDNILDIVKDQIFILDSIHRKTNYDSIYDKVWRYQMNSLTKQQRYILYDQLKQLKQLINLFKLFKSGFSLFFICDLNDIWKKTKKLMECIQLDFSSQSEIFESQIWQDFKGIILDKNVQILKKTKVYLKINNLEIFKDLLDITLQLIDFTWWFVEKKLTCKLCMLKNMTIEDFFKHVLSHFQFLHLFDANMGRCVDSKCISKRNHKTQDFNLKQHTLDIHSKCYNFERPLRYCVRKNQHEYGKSEKKYQYFKNALVKILDIINTQYKDKFLQEWLESNLSRNNKEEYFMNKVIDDLQKLDNYCVIDNLGLFDIITIFLTTTWRKMFEDPLSVLDEKIPKWLKQLFASRKIPCYNQQLNILEIIIKGSQLESLKMKLLLGYFNIQYTFKELELFIQDLNDSLFGIAQANTILFGKLQKLQHKCIFNQKLLCDEIFDTKEKILKHYFQAHTGIITCFANEECQINNQFRIDDWIEHCHDFHKEDFITLSQNYVKQSKRYFQFKAICTKCNIKLESLTEVYWNKSEIIPVQQWKVNIKVKWQDLIKSYKEERNIDEIYMIEYQNSYESYKKNIVEKLESIITYNDEAKFSVCKRCKNNKVYKMPHLRKEQFQNREANKLFPLVKIEGKITGSDTFYRVIGNINALKKKPHIIFEGTDIMYEWNSTQAKKHFKCRLMDKSKIERIDYVKACKNHNFLVNHSYQLVDLSQQLIRQEKQILSINKNLWLRYLEKENISDAQDKLQAEFSKMQDMLLFDNLLHRTSIQFVCKNMKKPFNNLCQKLKNFVLSDRVKKHKFKNTCYQLLQQYDNLPLNEIEFWDITMLTYLICEQEQDDLLDFNESDQLTSLQELLLLNRDYNIFGDWFREENLVKVRSFIDYAIHPIYLGVYYQLAYSNFIAKDQLNENQKRIIKGLFQTLSNWIIETCLLNFGYTLPKPTNTFFQQTKEQLFRLDQYILQEMIDYLDDQQFIDMQTRIKIVEKAIINVMIGKQIEDILPSDLRWAVQMASIFLSSLKAQTHYFPPGKDRDVCYQHLEQIKGLKDEIEYFYSRNDATYNYDFLSTTYRELIQEIVDTEIFPIDDNGNKVIRNYTQQEIQQLSKYKNLKKLHIVFWIPVEDKLRNLLKVHKTIRELVEKEPYFQMSKEMNVTTFHKELEYAMFPHLYPNAQGGLVTKAPDPQYYQLIVDLVEQDKHMAPYHIQQLQQIRQNVIQQQKNQNQIINSNDLEIQVQLIDFKNNLATQRTSQQKRFINFQKSRLQMLTKAWLLFQIFKFQPLYNMNNFEINQNKAKIQSGDYLKLLMFKQELIIIMQLGLLLIIMFQCIWINIQ